MSLLLDSEHRYSVEGRRIPGVTEVIRYHAPSFGAGEWYLTRGRAVHLAVQLELENRLDWSTVVPEIKGRVESILKFVQLSKLKMRAVERIMFSQRYQFAGTIDFIGEDQNGRLILADWKGSVDEASKIQLAAYRLIYETEFPEKIHMAAAVECRDNGNFKAHWQNRRDLTLAGNIFLAMLTVYSWKNRSNQTNQSKTNGNNTEHAD